MTTDATAHALAACAVLASASFAPADDWPCWGGNDPGRNMYSPANGLPSAFDPGKFQPNSEEVDLATAKNVKWVAKLGSISYGNPVVANGRVFIGTNNACPRDPKYREDRSCLYAFSETNGDFLWQLAVPKLAIGKVNDWEYIGITATPYVDGGRVYLVTNRCEVVCLSAEGMRNGHQGRHQGSFTDEAKYLGGPGKPPIQPGPKDADIIWRYDMIDELGVFPHNNSNCSVIILGNRLYTCTSNGVDWTHVNVSSPQSPSLIALDKNSGGFLAEDDAAIGPRIKHSQWSSPSIGTVHGRTQVYFGGGDGVLYAFDPEPAKQGDTAYLKKIWWCDCVPEDYKHDKNGKVIKYPAAGGPSEIMATPVFYKNRVYVAIGQDPEHGEGVGRLVCMDASKTGDISRTGVLWEFNDIHRTLSTVSIDPVTGLLFVADFTGIIFCLDAETGKKYWEYDMKSHMWGSTLVADGKVYCGDEDGDVRVFAADKQLKVISETNMGAPVYSTPIVANGVLYISTATHLFAIAEGAKPVSSEAVQPWVTAQPHIEASPKAH